MPRFVFIDTEATGLDHSRHELTEVAWIVRFEDGTEATRQYVPEHTLDTAEPAALELTSYHEAIAPRPRAPATVWLRQFLDDAAGAYLVGAVPDFDATHLTQMCRKLGWEPTWDHHLIDVGTLALPLLADAPEGPRSLARTCRALGVQHDDGRAHGALYDAQQAMHAFDAVWERLARLRAEDAPLPDPVPRRGRGGMPQDGDDDGAARPGVELVEVTADTWRAIADVAPRPDQLAFVPPTAARYLLLSQHSVWNSLGIAHEGTVVGHVMWARDDEAAWIGGLVVDARHQRRGIARRAVELLMERLGDDTVACTVHPDNHASARLWESLGFEPTDEFGDGERMWRRAAPAVDEPAAEASST